MTKAQVPIPLYDILALDEEGLTVTVEPMVTVGGSHAHRPSGHLLTWPPVHLTTRTPDLVTWPFSI